MKFLAKLSILLLLSTLASAAPIKADEQVQAVVSSHSKMASFADFVAFLGAHAADCRALQPVYRYFNGKDHLFTINAAEIGTTTPGATGNMGYRSEGIGFYAYSTAITTCPTSTGTASTPVAVYRYFNMLNHYFTTNPNEIGTTTPGATGNGGFKSEGVGFKAYSSTAALALRTSTTLTPVYRYYSLTNLDHYYTTNANEIGVTTVNTVGRNGYRYEGIAFHVPI